MRSPLKMALAFLTLPLLALTSLVSDYDLRDTWREIMGATPFLFIFWIPTATLAAHLTSVAANRKMHRLQHARK